MSNDTTPDVYRYTPADMRAAVAAERERCAQDLTQQAALRKDAEMATSPAR